MRQTQISINIELDDNHIPEKMTWNAQDGGVENQETKATMISVWDDKKFEALRIDLWTKDMPVDQMKVFLTNHKSFSKKNALTSFDRCKCVGLFLRSVYL